MSKVKPAWRLPAKEVPSAGSAVLDGLRGEILQLEAAANADAVAARAEVGKRLVAVKGELKHGQWQFWLNDHVPFTAATAKRAIQLWHLSQSDPETFEALRPLGLTKAYKLMAMAPAERDAFLSEAHEVPGAGIKTPSQMTFKQMMAVLYPAEAETEVAVTTKLVRSIRRQTLGLGRLLSALWDRVPSRGLQPTVTEALSVLSYELDAVVDALEHKSLIEGNVPSFQRVGG
ncbi:MAG: DUF3102 domain-containing protein [Polyangiaceae bacterium]